MKTHNISQTFFIFLVIGLTACSDKDEGDVAKKAQGIEIYDESSNASVHRGQEDIQAHNAQEEYRKYIEERHKTLMEQIRVRDENQMHDAKSGSSFSIPQKNGIQAQDNRSLDNMDSRLDQEEAILNSMSTPSNDPNVTLEIIIHATQD